MKTALIIKNNVENNNYTTICILIAVNKYNVYIFFFCLLYFFTMADMALNKNILLYVVVNMFGMKQWLPYINEDFLSMGIHIDSCMHTVSID